MKHGRILLAKKSEDAENAAVLNLKVNQDRNFNQDLNLNIDQSGGYKRFLGEADF
jgi:hypothetical protein